MLKEYVWIDDTLVAMVDSTGSSPVIYAVHTGQIDEPLVLTDPSQSVAWNGYVKPFGQAQTFSTATASIDLRLSGQWLQSETNYLHQNHYRDYDPSLGRYAEADPLGIDAGQNVCAYVDGSPLNWGDSDGLSGLLIIEARGSDDGSSGSGGLSGHAWISYTPDGGNSTTYSTWGDNPRGQPNGLLTKMDDPGVDPFAATRSTHLNNGQEASLMRIISKYRGLGQWGWTYFTPCSTFASEAWAAATGEHLNPNGPYSNPSTLMLSIDEANGGSAHGHR